MCLLRERVETFPECQATIPLTVPKDFKFVKRIQIDILVGIGLIIAKTLLN
jgi:hypothetical protein